MVKPRGIGPPRPDAVWDDEIKEWVVPCLCPCCRKCWIVVRDGGWIARRCIHHGPYTGYIEVPDGPA